MKQRLRAFRRFEEKLKGSRAKGFRRAESVTGGRGKQCIVSIAGTWEMAIKTAIGKRQDAAYLVDAFEAQIAALGAPCLWQF